MAYWDLQATSEIDPKNKEISKEFERVQFILSNLQPKEYENDPNPVGLGLCLPSRSSQNEIERKLNEKGVHGQGKTLFSSVDKMDVDSIGGPIEEVYKESRREEMRKLVMQ